MLVEWLWENVWAADLLRRCDVATDHHFKVQIGKKRLARQPAFRVREEMRTENGLTEDGDQKGAVSRSCDVQEYPGALKRLTRR